MGRSAGVAHAGTPRDLSDAPLPNSPGLTLSATLTNEVKIEADTLLP